MKGNSYSIKDNLIIGIFIVMFLIIILALRFINLRYRLNEEGLASYPKQVIKPPIEFSNLRLYNRFGQLLPHSQWQNKSIIFYVTPLPCKHICQQSLSKLQKIYKTYWKKPRLDLLVGTFSIFKDQHLSNLLTHHYRRVAHVYISKHAFLRVFSHVKSKRAAIFKGMFYLVNPQGKVIMDYPPTIPINVIKRDLP